jgi:protein TonB
MKFFVTCTALVMLSAFPALGQVSDSNNQPAASSESGPIDLSGFRDQIANKNKALNDKVAAEKLMLKKNAAIIDDAKKIADDNKRLDAERKQLDAQNSELERQQRAIMSSLTDSSSPSAAPAPTYVAQPTPARVEQPTRVESQPAHMELANANVIPNSSNNNQIDRSNPAADPMVRTPPVGQISQPQQNQEPTQMASIPTATSATVVASASSGPMPVPESQAMGLLLSPIRAVYPQIAQNARIEGEVVLDAVISKDGLVESLRPISGPEMLRNAAADAVRRAHYQPYRVNGEAVEMSTTVTVAFRMRS